MEGECSQSHQHEGRIEIGRLQRFKLHGTALAGRWQTRGLLGDSSLISQSLESSAEPVRPAWPQSTALILWIPVRSYLWSRRGSSTLGQSPRVRGGGEPWAESPQRAFGDRPPRRRLRRSEVSRVRFDPVGPVSVSEQVEVPALRLSVVSGHRRRAAVCQPGTGPSLGPDTPDLHPGPSASGIVRKQTSVVSRCSVTAARAASCGVAGRPPGSGCNSRRLRETLPTAVCKNVAVPLA